MFFKLNTKAIMSDPSIQDFIDLYLELVYKFNFKFMSNYQKRVDDYDYYSVIPYYDVKNFDSDIYSRMEAGYLLDDI
jgi:hypothetical protein